MTMVLRCTRYAKKKTVNLYVKKMNPTPREINVFSISNKKKKE